MSLPSWICPHALADSRQALGQLSLALEPILFFVPGDGALDPATPARPAFQEPERPVKRASSLGATDDLLGGPAERAFPWREIPGYAESCERFRRLLRLSFPGSRAGLVMHGVPSQSCGSSALSLGEVGRVRAVARLTRARPPTSGLGICVTDRRAWGEGSGGQCHSPSLSIDSPSTVRSGTSLAESLLIAVPSARVPGQLPGTSATRRRNTDTGSAPSPDAPSRESCAAGGCCGCGRDAHVPREMAAVAGGTPTFPGRRLPVAGGTPAFSGRSLPVAGGTPALPGRSRVAGGTPAFPGRSLRVAGRTEDHPRRILYPLCHMVEWVEHRNRPYSSRFDGKISLPGSCR